MPWRFFIESSFQNLIYISNVFEGKLKKKFKYSNNQIKQKTFEKFKFKLNGIFFLSKEN